MQLRNISVKPALKSCACGEKMPDTDPPIREREPDTCYQVSGLVCFSRQISPAVKRTA